MKKLLIFLSLLFTIALPAEGSQILTEAPFFTMNTDGTICASCEVTTYECGTTTLKTTYTSASLSIAQTNPVVLGSDGRSANPIFFEGCIKYELTDADGNVLDTQDNQYGQGSSILDFAVLSDYASLSAAVTAIGANRMTLYINTDDTMSGNITVPSTLELIGTGNGENIITTTGYALTINSRFSAGRYQVFDGTGTVSLAGNDLILVEWLGVDTVNADNSVEIRQALDAANANDAEINFGNGTYLTDNILLDQTDDNLTISGQGWDTELKLINNGDEQIFQLQGTSADYVENIVFKNIAFNGNCGLSGTTCNNQSVDVTSDIPIIALEGTKDVRIENCKFTDPIKAGVAIYSKDKDYAETIGTTIKNSLFGAGYMGIELMGCDSSAPGVGEDCAADRWVLDTIISNNQFVDINTEALDSNQMAKYVVLDGNIFDGCYADATAIQSMVDFQESRDIIISNNNFNLRDLAYVGLTIKMESYGVTIQGNTFRNGNDGHGPTDFSAAIELGEIYGLSVSGNTIDAFDYGIIIRKNGATTSYAWSITGNTMYNILVSGITTATIAGQLHNAQVVNIINNLIYGRGTATGSGMILEDIGVYNIHGNMVSGFLGYGIKVFGSPSQVLMGLNYIGDNGTGGLLFESDTANSFASAIGNMVEESGDAAGEDGINFTFSNSDGGQAIIGMNNLRWNADTGIEVDSGDELLITNNISHGGNSQDVGLLISSTTNSPTYSAIHGNLFKGNATAGLSGSLGNYGFSAYNIEAGETIPSIGIYTSTACDADCRPGDLCIDTDLGASGGLRMCTAADTWVNVGP